MRHKKRSGFTLIELMFVIIIGGIIFSLALITFRDFSPQAVLSVEKQTVGSIKSGISFYYLDPARGNMSAFPSLLDGAASGSDASAANPFFGQVLFDPVTRGWRKVDANTWEATGSGNYYQYDATMGVFGQVSAEAVPTTTTTLPPTTTTIYACGPRPMLKAVAEIASQKKIDCQVSMEERMACAIGACKGCATKTRSGFKMVCSDGPVFDAKELLWN